MHSYLPMYILGDLERESHILIDKLGFQSGNELKWYMVIHASLRQGIVEISMIIQPRLPR